MSAILLLIFHYFRLHSTSCISIDCFVDCWFVCPSLAFIFLSGGDESAHHIVPLLSSLIVIVTNVAAD